MSIAPRLEAYLASRVGTPVRVSSLARKSGGASRETYLFDAEWEGSDRCGFVLRRDPVASLLESERSQEYRVLEAARGLGVPVPAVRWLELGREALDRPFFVMERVEGMVTPPTFPMAYPDEMRDRCAEDFVSILGRIHRADWRGLGFDFLDAPDPGIEAARRAIDCWRGIFEQDRIEPNPVLTRAFEWLEGRVPETDVVTLVHADYRSGNYLHDGEGRITAMLDWEMAHLGDPHEDLGWAAMPYWSSGGRICGLLTQDDFVARWEAATGFRADRARLRFYQVLGTAKMMTIALTGVRNLCEARTSEPTLAIVGLLNGRLARELLELMEVAPRGGFARMRPDLGDILSAVQRLLQTDVVPAVADPFVAEQLSYASLLLEYAKKAWPVEHVSVAEEHRDLDATLRALMPLLAALPGDPPATLLQEVRSHLGQSAVTPPIAALDAVLARDREGRALLDRAVSIGSPSDERAGADARARLRATIDDYLLRAARRQEAAIALLGFTW